MEDTVFLEPAPRPAFTITYHYLFPQLTMGLAWIIVYFKWRHLRTGEERFATPTRFWARIFGVNFAVGVVTGIPMEFQFGTNWAGFSKFSGNIIGQTLAMEGMFAFFLESATSGPWSGAVRARPAQTFSGHSRRGAGQLAVGLFHSRDECVYATSRRLYHGNRWFVAVG